MINTEKIELDAPTQKRFQFIIKSIFQGRRDLMDKDFSILIADRSDKLNAVLKNQFGNNVTTLKHSFVNKIKSSTYTDIVIERLVVDFDAPLISIKECYRVLTANGMLIITVPLHFYEESLKDVLKERGFTIVKIEYIRDFIFQKKVIMVCARKKEQRTVTRMVHKKVWN